MTTNPPACVGIDFGTTNSAIAISDGHEAPRLISLGDRAVCRTLLYFEPDDAGSGVAVSAGARAMDRYVESGGDGRLIQSIKSHLASGHFTRTHIYGRAYQLEDIVAAFIGALRDRSDRPLGHRAVVGRPVRYWGARDGDDDRRAIERMRGALDLAGFTEVIFEYEPVAAALRYGAALERDELVLIADLGGGTTDFCLLRVGPGIDPRDPGSILGTAGIGVGGDAFDGRMVGQVVAPHFGKGTTYRTAFGRRMPIPTWLFGRLSNWHHLSFLRTPDTLRLLREVERGAAEPARVRAFHHLVSENLGYPLYRAVERTKVALTSAAHAPFAFAHDPEDDGIDIADDVTVADFDAWIAPDLDTIDGVLDDLLRDTDVAAGAIDRVFTTGGSSLVPAVRARLRRRFGADRFCGGGELTSVATGLALRAQHHFGTGGRSRT